MKKLEIPPLAEGETYFGVVGNQHGEAHHVILLPGDSDDATWEEQMQWAKSIGGDLPTKAELAMLWNVCREQFQKDAYWSNQVHEIDPSYVWYQHFYGGNQNYGDKGARLRARAVRRLPI